MSVKKKVKKTQGAEHPDHNSEINRINRVVGQLGGVKKMIEENRYCIDILQQTSAITSAIQALEKSILKKHFEHCVRGAFSASSKQDAEEKIEELLKIFARNR